MSTTVNVPKILKSQYVYMNMKLMSNVNTLNSIVPIELTYNHTKKCIQFKSKAIMLFQLLLINYLIKC